MPKLPKLPKYLKNMGKGLGLDAGNFRAINSCPLVYLINSCQFVFYRKEENKWRSH